MAGAKQTLCALALLFWVGVSVFLVYFEGFIFWLLFIFDFHFFFVLRERDVWKVERWGGSGRSWESEKNLSKIC